VSKTISAATGGTIEAPGVKLVIPPGALAADTTISVTVRGKSGVPDEGKVASSVFDFGPNGLQFTVPATLQLDFDGSNAPADSTAKVAVLDGSTWKPLSDSKVSGSTATATTTHFSAFAVVWSQSGQTSGACGQNFNKCGGDISGTWSYSAGCVTLPPESNPLGSTCPEAVYTVVLDVSGTLNLASGGSYTVDNTVNMTATIDFPKSCLSGAPCDALAGQGGTVKDNGDSCSVTQSQPPQVQKESGTYSVNGSTITFTGSDGKASTADYCVTGTTAQLYFQNGQTTSMYELKKQ
jgi:hypothetical protein